MIQNQFGVEISMLKTQRLRHKLGWVCSKTKYCQMVRETSRVKRLDHANLCIANEDKFDDIIWSNECNVQLESNGNLTYHCWWETCPQNVKPKHPIKVCIWAAISKRGASPVLVFQGIMEATFFSERIIGDTLVPFIGEVFPDGHRFMQDNDPKHTSNLGKKTLEESDINWWKTPPESPDLNPIENLWHQLKDHLRRNVKPRNLEELLRGIREFWSNLTPAKCVKYIDHIQRVLPVVVEREGKATGF